MEPRELSKVIADTASIELQDKFNKGQQEHGGDFELKPTVRNIREESLDLINYSHMLIKHRSNLLIMIDQLLNDLPTLNEHVIHLRLKDIRNKIHDL